MPTWRMSFAFNGGGAWWFYKRDGVHVPLEEIKQAAVGVEAEEGLLAKIDFVEAIRVKIKAAQLGELTPPDDVKTDLARAAGLHELRWRIERKQWRLYYCEPPRLYVKRIMLGLLFNEKTTSDLQDEDIDNAVNRYIWWTEANSS